MLSLSVRSGLLHASCMRWPSFSLLSGIVGVGMFMVHLLSCKNCRVVENHLWSKWGSLVLISWRMLLEIPAVLLHHSSPMVRSSGKVHILAHCRGMWVFVVYLVWCQFPAWRNDRYRTWGQLSAIGARNIQWTINEGTKTKFLSSIAPGSKIPASARRHPSRL